MPSRILVALLGALTALAPLSIDAYLPGLPLLARDFGAPTSTAQLTLTACLLGLALGQALAGPLSDAYGRRRPLLIGLAAYTAACLLCAIAPSIWILIPLRLAQGAAGAAGIVVANAIVRDRASGTSAARLFATLALVMGVAPVLAPLAGAQVLRVTSWRGVFVALAVLGALLLLAAARVITESLPPERRRRGGGSSALRAYRHLLRQPSVLGCALAIGLGGAAMFAYISGSPFVLEKIYHLSPQAYSIAFALNGAGLAATSHLGGRLVARTGSRMLLVAGVATCALAGLTLLAAVITGVGLVVLLPAFFVLVSSMGLIFPQSTALALADQQEHAGSTAALLGLAQFLLGACAAPLVGLAGTGTAVPMGVTIAALGVAAAASLPLLFAQNTVEPEPELITPLHADV